MESGDGRIRGYASRRPWSVGLLLLTGIFAGAAGAGVVTYTYDDAGRLTAVQYDDGAGVSYTLDAAGNRTQVSTTAPTPITAPGLTAQPASDNAISLSWTVPTGGNGLYTYTVSRNGTPLPQTITSNSMTDSGLSPTTTYTYTVIAKDSDGSVSPQSSSASATTYSVPVIATFTASTATASQINLSWNATDAQGPGIGQYKLYRGGSIINTFAAATTSYSDTGLSPGTTYSYILYALDSAGDSISASSSATTYSLPILPAPGVAATSPTTMTITWGGSDSGGPGGLTYTVVRGSTTLSCTSSPCYDSGLSPGTLYAYTVTATDSVGDKATSSGSQYTDPSAPGTVTISSITTTSAVVSWGASSGAASFYEYSINGGASWTSTGTATSTTITGLASGTSYTVLVQAANVGGIGPQSSDSFMTVVGAPTLSDSGSGVACPTDILRWGTVTGATSYQLWSREYTPSLSSSYNEIYSGTASSLKTSLPTGYGYYYQAAACNANGCGAFSNTLTVREGTCP